MSKILVFGHKNPDTDTICSAIAMEDMQRKMGVEAEAVRLGEINKETKYALDYFNTDAPKLIERVEEGQEVILVDHNEFQQSADGIEKAKILRVVDHHKISDFKTSEPLYYTAMPVGCTATIIYGMYKEENIEVEPKIAGLLLSAIISDTLLFKSPTCTEKDVEAANKLAEIANVDLNTYGLDMLNHPNWFDASYMSWISYDSLNVELPDGYLFFMPIINWGRYRQENGRLVMPVTVRLNHASADGYLSARVYKILEEEIKKFCK